jgi:hypothetical protein
MTRPVEQGQQTNVMGIKLVDRCLMMIRPCYLTSCSSGALFAVSILFCCCCCHSIIWCCTDVSSVWAGLNV